MKEELVTHKQAVKLKELGFKARTLYYYEDSKLRPYNQDNGLGWDFNTSFITCQSAPFRQQVFKWFREEYSMYGGVTALEDESAFYYLISTHVKVPFANRICSLSNWEEFEQAEDACIDKIIELIESKPEN